MAKKDTDLKPDNKGGAANNVVSPAVSTLRRPAGGTPRRAPGQKEVIPFAWKVCGYAYDGHTLTLFKAVECADAEAQLARLQQEAYYEGLKVYGIDEAVPPSPLARKLQAAKDRAARRQKKTRKKVVSKGSSPKKSASAARASARKATRSRGTARTPASRKTSAARTTGKKATARKKTASARSRKKASPTKAANKPRALKTIRKKAASKRKARSKAR